MVSEYRCPVCGVDDPNAYLRCNHPGCTDGRDPRPVTEAPPMTEPLTLAQRLIATADYIDDMKSRVPMGLTIMEEGAQKFFREAATELTRLRDANKALTAQRDAARHHTSNLLARIHRDGGHYESEHGTSKAVEDADGIVASLYTDRDRLSAELAEARSRLRLVLDHPANSQALADARTFLASKEDGK